MGCCGNHRRELHGNTGHGDRPRLGITQPDDPCVFCAEKHFATAKRLAYEVGYDGPNRQDVLGELVLCGWHLARSGALDLWNEVRRIRTLIQFRRENEVDWRKAAMGIDALATAKARELMAHQTQASAIGTTTLEPEAS